LFIGDGAHSVHVDDEAIDFLDGDDPRLCIDSKIRGGMGCYPPWTRKLLRSALVYGMPHPPPIGFDPSRCVLREVSHVESSCMPNLLASTCRDPFVAI
jgi:hypothetical protein